MPEPRFRPPNEEVHQQSTSKELTPAPKHRHFAKPDILEPTTNDGHFAGPDFSEPATRDRHFAGPGIPGIISKDRHSAGPEFPGSTATVHPPRRVADIHHLRPGSRWGMMRQVGSERRRLGCDRCLYLIRAEFQLLRLKRSSIPSGPSFQALLLEPS